MSFGDWVTAIFWVVPIIFIGIIRDYRKKKRGEID
jgi:hypothetical protein